MNFLPYNVTGFFDHRSPVLPCIPLKKFTELCHAVAQRMSAQVVRIESHNVGTNFYKATLATQHGELSILCNVHYPFVAAAEQVEFLNIRFVLLRELIQTAGEWMGDFAVVPMEILQAAPTPELLSGLNNAELHQYKYWKPEKTGDIIFNFWD